MRNGWKSKELGDTLTLQRGFDLPHRMRRDGQIPIVSSSGISGWHDRAQVDPPGIVTGRYGTVGDVFYVEVPFWPLNTTLFVRDFKGNDPLYLSYMLRTIDFQSHSGKSGVPGVNRNDLHKLSVKIPPIPEQRAIAAALADVDELIEALDNLIAKKRAIKLATTQQLLTGKTRLPGFGGEWRTSTVGAEFEMQLGKMLDASTNTGVSKPYVGNRAVQWGNINTSEIRTVPLTPSDLIRFRLQKGDLLVCEGGEVGRAAIWEEPITECYYQKAIHRLRPINGYDSRLLMFFLQLWSTTGYLNNFVTQTSIAHLPKDKFAIVPLAAPSPSEQRAISEVFLDMDAEIAALEKRRDKTKAIKQGMMQSLLTGRVRLVEPECTP